MKAKKAMNIADNQKKHWRLKFLLALVVFAFFLFAREAFAGVKQTGNPDLILDGIEALIKGKTLEILRYARSLFWHLSLLSLAIGVIRHILSGDSNLGSIAAILVKWILFVGVFMWLMGGRTGTGDFLPYVILDSFTELGEKITNAQTKPGAILIAGVDVCGNLLSAAKKHGMVQSIIASLNCIVLMVIFAMLSTFITVALIEMYVVICGGSILLGFAGFENTRDIAMSYLKYAVAVGVKILIVMIIASMTIELVTEWGSKLDASAEGFFATTSFLTGGASTLALAAYFVPNIAQSAVSGSSIGGSLPGAVKAAAGLAAGAWGATTAPVKWLAKRRVAQKAAAKTAMKKATRKKAAQAATARRQAQSGSGSQHSPAQSHANYVRPPKPR